MGSTNDATSKSKNSTLTVDDVCRILKSSEESGILKLKFRDLEFERGQAVKNEPPTPAPTPSENAIPEETHKRQNEQQLLVDELRLKRERLAELQITDPLEFERMIADGELVPEEDTDDGERPD